MKPKPPTYSMSPFSRVIAPSTSFEAAMRATEDDAQTGPLIEDEDDFRYSYEAKERLSHGDAESELGVRIDRFYEEYLL